MPSKVVHALADCIGRSLKPLVAVGRLFGGQNIYETIAEIIEMVGVFDMSVERCGVELGEHKHALHAGIDTIGNGDVDESVFSTDGNGWF